MGRMPILDELRGGLARLLTAAYSTSDRAEDPWRYAVDIETLKRSGLACNDIQWLMDSGYIEHRCESGRDRSGARLFLPPDRSEITRALC